MNLIERLETKTKKAESGCWLWVGGIGRGGYGVISIGGRQEAVHRVSYELRVGELGDNCCLHKCDVRNCLNPDHLFLGTVSDNNRDRAGKGRSDDRKGMKNASAKLTESDVLSIRSDTRNQYVIAGEYGVSQGQISDIKSRKKWSHI